MEKLKKFLMELRGQDVEDVYAWLDGNPAGAAEEMKVVIAMSHPDLDR